MAENVESQEPEKKKGGIASLILWILLACVSIGGGFAAPFVMDQFGSNAKADSTNPSEASDEEPPALIEFGEVTVNLNETRLNRYLRLNLSFLVAQSQKLEVEQALEKNQPVLKSWLLSYLADKAMEDIRGATGQNRLRREIHAHFNSVMFPGKPPMIRNILFQEFNIQ